MDSARGAIREAMLAAPRGERTATADRLAALYRVSRSAVYAAARVGGAKRPRVSRPDYEAWTETASAIALLAPKPMPLDVAIRAGVESGELPPEAAAMPLGTAQRIRRRRGWRAAPKRHGRLSAERPLQAAQVDGSGSEHLVVEEERDGDWVLRLHRRPWSASGYKNKPLGPGRLSLKIYALWDMCTGAVRSRYCVARGETALDALEFLVWAFGAPGSVVRGVPENLWSDLGPLARHAASRDLLERLDVHVDLPGEGYAKERMGGVERSHRTRWSRFERGLFALGRERLTLGEANARLARFENEENDRRASRTQPDGRRLSRSAAWRALAAGIRELPPEPMETLASEARRVVDGAGIVRWGGAEYECGQWHSRRVLARRPLAAGADADALVLEDEATGERAIARRLRPRPYGEVRRQPAAPVEGLPRPKVAADLWAPDNVAPMPARLAPAAELADPLDADRLADGEDPMAAFRAICPRPLSAASLAAVEGALARAGRSRRAIEAIAREVAAIEQAEQAR